ncbi:MAG: hypothetical protein NTW32_01345 [Chloroflexi bacterium]|nr:hypothetical protein [Chloroflexota bacterium]
MKASSKREQSRIRQQRQKWITYGIGAGVALIILGILGTLVWKSTKTQSGEVISIPVGYQTHMEVGTAITYPSDPPAGGLHYAEEFPNDFFDETSLPSRPGDTPATSSIILSMAMPFFSTTAPSWMKAAATA